MSIRARLTIGLVFLLVVVFAAMGVAMARSTESALIDQADLAVHKQSDRLVGPANGPRDSDGGQKQPDGSPAASKSEGTPAANRNNGASSGQQPEDDEYAAGEQTVASFVYGSDGALKYNSPSGYADDPDSPPDLPAIGSDEFKRLVGHIHTLPSEDGTLDYRVLVEPGRFQGDYAVVAAPLAGVRTTVRSLIKRFIVAGSIGLILAALAVWWVVRSEFRPVDSMIDTAAAIAGGDLSLRVPEQSLSSELGRLGAALNNMLGQIEAGLAQRDLDEQRLRRFIADAAHELRTPLTSVRGYSELYRQGAYPDQAAVDHAMGRIESEGARMARLVDDLLLLARMDQHRPLEQRPVDLVSLANEAATDFATVSTDHPLEWQPEGEVIVRGDTIRLRQIIDNLLANARTHTPAGTTIRMAVLRAGNNAELIISDNGPGIAAADRGKVFERFWRADASRTRNTGGSGLGLAIVRSLVEAHGGSVRLESEIGAGATFTIRLPLMTAQPPVPM